MGRMSIDVTWQTDCTDLEQSLALAERLGKLLKGSEVIELVSDLGGGKTTFVRGLAKGAGSTDQVSSPTFTLNNVYTGTTVVMYHFDFYRLNEPGIMRDEIAEVVRDNQAVTVVEWAGIVDDVLPEDKLTITITATGEFSRHYKFNAGRKYQQIIEGIKS